MYQSSPSGSCQPFAIRGLQIGSVLDEAASPMVARGLGLQKQVFHALIFTIMHSFALR
jgi:hypothetical protein